MAASKEHLSQDEYMYRLSNKSPENLRKECLQEFLKIQELEGKLKDSLCEKEVLESTSQEMTKQFRQKCKELSEAQEEIEKLRKLSRHLSEQLSHLKALHFGPQSEQGVVDVILDANEGDEENVAYVELTLPDGSVILVPKQRSKGHTGKSTGKKGHGGRPKGSKNKINLDSLDKVIVYDFDFDAMDEKYGEGNYRIFSFRSTKRIEKVRPFFYIKEIRTPVYSVGLEHSLVCPVSLTNPVLPKSYLTSSFVADFCTQHDVLCVPFYRQEAMYTQMGYPVSRGQLAHWRIMFATGPFQFVYDVIKEYSLANHMYQFIDETRWMVVMDGKKPGHMSWIWDHVSGIEAGEHTCVIYAFELTRSTEHLRTYYEGYSLEKLFMICDGYVSYPCFAAENKGKVIVCRDWMHVRRKFITALDVLKNAKVSKEVLVKTPEFKILASISPGYGGPECQGQVRIRTPMVDEMGIEGLVQAEAVLPYVESQPGKAREDSWPRRPLRAAVIESLRQSHRDPHPVRP